MEKTVHITSERLQDRQRVIAQGALTNSKHPDSYIKGVYPTHLVSGRGAHVKDNKGKEYIDFISGLGTNLLGYGHKVITKSIFNNYCNGINLSLPTNIEVEAAEQILTILPQYHQVKFLKSGTDACNAAVRIARSHTGRKKILTSGYHGWGDTFISTLPVSFGAHDINSEMLINLDQIDETVAGVIVEPVILDFDVRDHLIKLQDKCNSVGALLIFDEIITAMRVPDLTITKHYNLEPDLVLMGKALAGGLPLSCVVGKKEIMDDRRYFVSGTFYGEMLSLAVCRDIIFALKTKRPNIDDLWVFGEHFKEIFNKNLNGIVQLEGFNTRFSLKGEPKLKALFMQEAAKAGMLFGASPFISFAHIELSVQIEQYLKNVANKINTGMAKLEGELPSSPFANKQRNI